MMFSTHSNETLARAIARARGIRMGKCVVDRFADGEVHIQVKEDVSRGSVYVCGSTFPPAEHAMELFLMIRALHEHGARRICAVIPYFGYGKADYVARSGTPVSAKFMAQAIELAGAHEIVAVNMHSKAVGRFFKRPLIHVDTSELLASYFAGEHIGHVVVAAPDVGGVDRALRFARALGFRSIVRIRKERPRFNTVRVVDISGDVKGKSVIIVDDMIQSGGTIIEAARVLAAHGARDVYVAVTHLVPTDSGIERLEREAILRAIVYTNTIPQQRRLSAKFHELSVARLIADVVP